MLVAIMQAISELCFACARFLHPKFRNVSAMCILQNLVVWSDKMSACIEH